MAESALASEKTADYLSEAKLLGNNNNRMKYAL